MSKSPKAPRRTRWLRRLKEDYKKNKWLFYTYFILRVLVVAVMVAQFFNGNYENVFLCLLTLVLFMIPSFFERRIKIDVPDTLEIIILLFIFAAEILGEIAEYYVVIPYWDTMLHTINGFLFAAIGYSMIDILNRSDRTALSLSPIFVSVVAFCFSMTIGVLWEFFEFGMDQIFRLDMQKDTWLSSISSVAIHPEGKNIPVILEDIQQVVIYHGGGTLELDAYLDLGRIDTMLDLLVNFVGAVVFCILGYFYAKRRSGGRFIRHFVPTRITGDEEAEAPAPQQPEGESPGK